MFRIGSVALLAMLALALTGAPATAQTAQSSAVITGCVGKKGALRVAKKCRKGEKKLRLLALPGEAGPKGDKGEKGDPGAPGATGTPGAPGANGANGAAGANGSPDTPAQVLEKLGQVDGSGSGLDADTLDGIDSGALQMRGTTTACAAGTVVSSIAANGDVTCADNPAYTAGDGLSLTEGAFAIDSPLLLQDSTAPPTVRVVNSSGTGLVTAIQGEVSSVTGGLSAAETAAGVTGRVTSTTPGGFSAGVLGVNSGTSGSGIGVTGVHNGGGWGVFGQSLHGRGVYGRAANNTGTASGVVGEALNVNGVAVEARYGGLGAGNSLTIHNGRIRVSGTNRPAFQFTVNATCGGGAFSALNNALINADPTVMLLVTHAEESTGGLIAVPDLGVVYAPAAAPVGDCPTDRWLLWNESNTAIPGGTKVNVLAITP